MRIGKIDQAVFDSNVFIDLKEGRLVKEDEALLADVLDAGDAMVSIVSHAELLAIGLDADTRQGLEEVLSKTTMIPFDRALLPIVVSIRRNYRLKLPDAIIAATALYLDLPLVTSDLRGFQSVAGLKCVVPGRRS